MSYFIIRIISPAYFYLILLSVIFFQTELTLTILLQNTLIFLLFSYVIFSYYNKYKQKRFSYASYITYARLIINILVLSIVIYIATIGNNVFYNNGTIFVICLISLFLDGIDGFIARYLRQNSKFGEIFDQETDTILLLILSLSININLGQSFLVFLVPLYRYIFLLTQYKVEWLNQALPKSQIRRFLCFLTTLTLILCHMPYIYSSALYYLVNFSIFLITFSFAKDIIWLYRNK